MKFQPYKTNYIPGQKIGELIFINRTESTGKVGHRHPMANFKCECGKEFICRIDSVKNLITKSCGCKKVLFNTLASTKHKPVERIGNGVKIMPNFTEDTKKRFWDKVDIGFSSDICWEWKYTSLRYGYFRIGRGMYKANRIAYFLHYEKDPMNLEVMHSCDNPKCCNPAHLSLGTHFENMQDMAKKGRANNIKYS